MPKEYQPAKALRMLLVALAMAVFGTSSIAADIEQQRAEFRQAWAAAARGDTDAVLDAMKRLAEYPLLPYLEFELLRQRGADVPENVMERFLARHRDWSFADILQVQWLRALGRTGDDRALLRHGPGATDIEVRCHLARARIRTGDTPGLADEVRALWMYPRSRPDACDPVFSWWRRQGNPGARDGWQRFSIAMQAGETGLARYLVRYLDDSDRIWSQRWMGLAERPAATLRQAAGWRDSERTRELVGVTLKSMASSDWKQADALWRRLSGQFDWPADAAADIERRIALFRAVALDEGAIAAIDALPDRHRDQQMLEWRARAGLAAGDWPGVLESIQAMPADEQLRDRWRYWRARALAELDRPEAGLQFAVLAGQSTYYGFLAASRLGQPKILCSQELTADPAIQRRLHRDAEFERALELYQVGLGHHARITWNRVSRRLSRDELRQAALLAAGIDWHDRAVFALGNAGAMSAYRWRFPLIERARVDAEARRWRVDPALIYGLMRAESAMQADALSPAGAHGLLQLMPGTASGVARRNRLAYHGPAGLMRPEVNIPLGIAHLAELEQRFDGDWTRVAAAYNAGIRSVERWQEQRPHPEADIWLETLPFFETRDYVPRVLAFATIYEWQLGRTPRILAANLLGRDVNHGFSCPDPAGAATSAGP